MWTVTIKLNDHLAARVPEEPTARQIDRVNSEQRKRQVEGETALDKLQREVCLTAAVMVEGWEGDQAPSSWPALDGSTALDVRLELVRDLPWRRLVQLHGALWASAVLDQKEQGNSGGQSA